MIHTWLDGLRPVIDHALRQRLPATHDRLACAMRYAVLGGGKRLRPAMVLAAADAVGGTRDAALPAAVAIELLHAYTLIHDDLPALDDDEVRRGRPTVHVKFDEATAILAGDALLTAAFAELADLDDLAAAAVAVLAARTGAAELIGGQMDDLAMQGADVGLAALEHLHARKTGALFAAAAELGVISAGAAGDVRTAFARYGMAVGVAFQFADDRDDGDFPTLAEARQARGAALIEEALMVVRPYGDRARPLVDLATWVGGRI